jgi:hypothetical protein
VLNVVCVLSSNPKQQLMAPLVISQQGINAHGYDIKRSKFPFCVVWTPLPLISWFLPMIGHTGICVSDGSVHDFAGPFYIGVDDMAFGKPTKFWQCDPYKVGKQTAESESAQDSWDCAVETADRIYVKMMHNICCNNCHSHVARALNSMAYEGKTNWTMISVFFRITLNSSYVSWGRLVKT